MLQAPVGATGRDRSLPLILGVTSAAPPGLGIWWLAPVHTANAVGYSLSLVSKIGF
jgi:hypothetical protein